MMDAEIKVPDMGESVIEATVVNWLKNEGDAVAAGEAVVELETDKVTLEVSSQHAGVLKHILHPSGDNVKVGDTLAQMAAEGAAPAESPALQPAAQPVSAPAPAQSASTLQPAPASLPDEGAEAPSGNGGARATPVAQRVAQEMGVDLAQVIPTGQGGRITKEDVEEFVARSKTTQTPTAAPQTPAAVARLPQKPAMPAPSFQAPPSQPARPASVPEAAGARGEERVRMSRRRQTIARRLVEVHQVTAMLTTFNEIDMSTVVALRKKRREGFKERFGVDLGYMSFFVKATIAALIAFPYLNAEIQGDEIVIKHYYDIGIAIGAEEGLVVPVIRDADRLNFAGIEQAIRQFADKAQNNTLSLEELRGGTFTITNGGVYGSLMSTPILNPPQVGILGMHAIKERPVAVNGQVEIRPMMYVALSYDHRIVDGREAVQFLVRLKELVEDPESLLFG
jgi:2-oxoglutarate dehydrogenase E2 component (dihydrolipoamide succinyltransferase)